MSLLICGWDEPGKPLLFQVGFQLLVLFSVFIGCNCLLIGIAKILWLIVSSFCVWSLLVFNCLYNVSILSSVRSKWRLLCLEGNCDGQEQCQWKDLLGEEVYHTCRIYIVDGSHVTRYVARIQEKLPSVMISLVFIMKETSNSCVLKKLLNHFQVFRGFGAGGCSSHCHSDP